MSKKKTVTVFKINKNRFDIFMLFSRHSLVNSFYEEVEYYSNDQTSILGVILFDYTDSDFNFVLMARDENRQFRAFEIIIDLKSLEIAQERIIDLIKWHTINSPETVVQKTGKPGIKLFDLQLPNTKLHPYFIKLKDDNQFTPSKKAIIEIANHFNDIDGNFVEQFQSVNGFDSRMWEIYLFASLIEMEFEIIREHDRPDFLVKKYDVKIGIEAVTLGRQKGNPPRFLQNDNQSTLSEMSEKLIDEIPLKYSSALHSKLKKKYWELPHIKGNPLIIAIADFHDDLSMVWTYSALLEYLYGHRDVIEIDDNNNIEVNREHIGHYTKQNGTQIPSGFFFQKDVENISAVLFSATGTIAKFTRMGIQAGFGHKNQAVLRVGDKFNHDEDFLSSKPFIYQVNENGNEKWQEGLNLFLNPNAKYPISEYLFHSIAVHKYENGQVMSYIPDFHPYSSINFNMITKK